MPQQKLKVACAGLGRMGKRHALHFLERTPRAELVAASTPDPTEIAWAQKYLEPAGVRIYDDYDEMIKQEGLQAVVIASVTTVHAVQAIKGINAGLHVLCEKPLSTSVEIVCSPPCSKTSLQDWHHWLTSRTVTVSRRCCQKEAGSQSHVWLLSAFRRLLP